MIGRVFDVHMRKFDRKAWLIFKAERQQRRLRIFFVTALDDFAGNIPAFDASAAPHPAGPGAGLRHDLMGMTFAAARPKCTAVDADAHLNRIEPKSFAE